LTSRLINGLVLVVVGAILLMNTTGYLPWGVWDAALGYWPVLLVGLGLQIAMSKWRFPGFALAVVAILILAAMHPYDGPSFLRNWEWLRPGSPSYRPSERMKEWSVPLKPTTSGLDLHLEAPSVEIEARGDPGLNLVQPGLALAAKLSWDRSEPETSVQELDGAETVRASLKSLAEGTNAGKQTWELALNPSLATSLSVTGGVSNLRLDMSSVFVQSVNVSSGVSRLDLTLGLSGKETSVNVTGGVGNVNLTVPEAAGVRITLTGLLALSDDFSKQGLVKTGDTWSTPDYPNASTKVDVTMACGTGKVTLVRSAWD
jgi:hypothetical protein